MNLVFDALFTELLNPRTAVGAVVWGVVFLGAATMGAAMIRRFAGRVGSRLSDVTGVAFVSAFAQVLAYLLGLILYAHLIPELRSLGTALLAGASVVPVVLGLAAQGTLSNLVAGLSLVLYRPFRVRRYGSAQCAAGSHHCDGGARHAWVHDSSGR